MSGLALSCHVLLGLDDPSFGIASDAGDAGTEAGADADAEDLTCSFGVQPPGPPSGDSPPVGERYTMAVRTLRLGGAPGDGFDLDHACTCFGEGRAGQPSCVPPEEAIVPEACDDDGGVDNAIRSWLTRTIPTLGQTLSDEINMDIACGRRTLVFSLQDYNGEADDPEVTVHAFASFGIHEASDAQAPECPPGLRSKWDGKDKWSVDKDLIQLQNLPTGTGFVGYVRNHTLVVDSRKQKDLSVPMPGVGNPSIEVRYPVLRATLIREGDGWGLADGIIGGRISQQALPSLARMKIIAGGAGVPACTLGASWDQFRDSFCNYSDLRTNPAEDFKDLPCDALSFVVSFTASPAEYLPADVPVEPLPDCGSVNVGCD
ncbi:MAG: hypothetical protein KF850_03100 [Labilithrix sp.]|nr:hypothetical protein [Labilithrix sp.]